MLGGSSHCDPLTRYTRHQDTGVTPKTLLDPVFTVKVDVCIVFNEVGPVTHLLKVLAAVDTSAPDPSRAYKVFGCSGIVIMIATTNDTKVFIHGV